MPKLTKNDIKEIIQRVKNNEPNLIEVFFDSRSLNDFSPLENFLKRSPFDSHTNSLTREEVKALGEALQTNHHLQVLTLSGNNNITTEIEAIAKGLENHSCLRIFVNSGNFIGILGGEVIGKALKINRSLETLDLSDNRIGDENAPEVTDAKAIAAEAIGKALETHPSLKTLNLTRNSIGNKGTAAISNGLKNNSSLKTLDLSYNFIGTAGAAAIGEALKSNKTLKIINLELNPIGDEGVKYLIEALRVNHTVIKITLKDFFPLSQPLLQKLNALLELNQKIAAENNNNNEIAKLIEQKSQIIDKEATPALQQMGLFNVARAETSKTSETPEEELSSELSSLKL